jgi:hypothetical protein
MSANLVVRLRNVNTCRGNGELDHPCLQLGLLPSRLASKGVEGSLSTLRLMCLVADVALSSSTTARRFVDDARSEVSSATFWPTSA